MDASRKLRVFFFFFFLFTSSDAKYEIARYAFDLDARALESRNGLARQ